MANDDKRRTGYTTQDAIEEGRRTAQANHKKDFAGLNGGPTQEETMDDARETAQVNHDAEAESFDEGTVELKNDTTKTAKEATAKSQLDPDGSDPISAAEVNRSAHNASMNTGNKTSVSKEEAAERAQNPGKAEEAAPRALKPEGGPNEPINQDVVHQVSEKSTSNRDEVREVLNRRDQLTPAQQDVSEGGDGGDSSRKTGSSR